MKRQTPERQKLWEVTLTVGTFEADVEKEVDVPAVGLDRCLTIGRDC
jgi:hypothetical protein